MSTKGAVACVFHVRDPTVLCFTERHGACEISAVVLKLVLKACEQLVKKTVNKCLQVR